ncbi:uncharacterized protein LOC105394902 [Plutella xylostella]|uniref:uncharacterized protein LOC105394902 n=1 Tax=Plutella xylostella TaxID=51655 RepID=UPI0020324020|nr:uncharacterized protein LOC105394902 [Plutella xylostella]
MAPRRRVTDKQLDILLSFVDKWQKSSLDDTDRSGGPLAKETRHRRWAGLAIRLNAIEGGVVKSAFKWRRYWIEFKNTTKAKAADRRRQLGYRDENSQLQSLDRFALRALAIMGLPPPGDSQEFPDAEASELSSLEDFGPNQPLSQGVDASGDPLIVIENLDYPDHDYVVQEVPVESYIAEDKNEPESEPEATNNDATTTENEPRGDSFKMQTPPSLASADVPAWAYELELGRLRMETEIAGQMGSLVRVMERIVNTLDTKLTAIHDAVRKIASKK